MSVKRFFVGGAVVAACMLGAGLAIAEHVPQVDPDDVPPGFLSTHKIVRDVAHTSLVKIAGRERIQVHIQHIQIEPNAALPWHTHPGPVVVTVTEGSLIYEDGRDGVCRHKTYRAGSGFVDPGFGHVHRAIGGPEGADFYATYLLPREAETHLIPTDPPGPCA